MDHGGIHGTRACHTKPPLLRMLTPACGSSCRYCRRVIVLLLYLLQAAALPAKVARRARIAATRELRPSQPPDAHARRLLAVAVQVPKGREVYGTSYFGPPEGPSYHGPYYTSDIYAAPGSPNKEAIAP